MIEIGYSDTISKLKDALNNYSEDEEKLSSFYHNALENADKKRRESKAQIENDYLRDRNEAYSDIKREERNLFNVLAQRGLGSSGEATQAKLNSDINLANRLGTLSRDKNKSLTELELSYADNINGIEKDHAEKLGDLNEKKNRLATDIAEIELDREMALAELNAKYNSLGNQTGNSGGNTAEDNTETDNTETDSEEIKKGYIPDIAPKELAKLVMQSVTGGSQISVDYHKYVMDKYILDLKTIYGIDENYLNDFLFMLEGYGYENTTDSEKKVNIICYDAKNEYKDIEDSEFEKFILAGYNETDAHELAVESATNIQLKNVYKRCENANQFLACCEKLGVDKEKANEFLKTVSPQKSDKNSLYFTGGTNGKRLKQTK